MKKLLIWIIGVLMVVAISTPARADEVTDWNEILFRLSIYANSSPLNMSRFSALVEAAVFDAVNGIDHRYTPIHVDPAAPAGASRRAAAVQAAYVIVSKLFGLGAGNAAANLTQQQNLDGRRTASLAAIAAHESPGAIASGMAWGQTVADAIWTWRSTDGFSSPATWMGSTLVGQWRPTPNDPYSGGPVVTVAAGIPTFSTMTPWAIGSPSQFRPAGPPALTSAQYATDFNETKLMGSLMSQARTTDQTNYSWFWALSTAPYLWNSVALSLLNRDDGDDEDNGGGRTPGGGSRARHDTLLRNARILAELNVAMADAAIGCWDAKLAYNFWRPITAIHEPDDGNPATTADATWKPLFSTPQHPDYPSGHSCVSGAAVVILADEFGDHTSFTMTNDILLGVTRSFHRFSDALAEVVNARVFAGIHFRTACEDGTALGKQVAQYVLDVKFQSVH
jgi:PAP2 superfamily protein